MDRKALERDLAPFLNRVEREFHPALVLLFGSRARGDSHHGSDFDFIIVSDRFKGMRWRDRVAQLIKLWDRNDLVDLVAYTPEEFAAKKAGFISIRKAASESIQLYPRVIN